MALGDSVVSENTLSWKLLINPTHFRGNFCAPVTRYFDSEPEPCSRQGYRWRCSFTEHMINGVASVDIEIWRIRAPQLRRQQPSQAHDNDHQDQPLSGMVAVDQPSPAESSSGSRRSGRDYPQSVDNPSPQQQHQALTQHLRYRTLSLHTPNHLAAIAFVSLHRLFKSGKPLRGKFELDADIILHKNLYQIEFVFSEEASYRLPSLMCCHLVFESLYHEIVSTCLPDQTMADIWFEFPISSTMDGQEDSSEATVDDNDDDCGGVEVVGAHSRVLGQYPYFAAWIEHERRSQEEQRRQQLEEEWRIHQQQQPLRQQHPSSSYHQRLEQSQEEDEQLSSDVTMASGRVRGYIPPPSLQCLVSTPTPQESSSQSHLEQFLDQPDQPPELVSFQSVTPSLVPEPRTWTSTTAGSGLRGASPSYSAPQSSHHPRQPRQVLLGHPLPALRIRVHGISLQTFKIILQFMYTGQIGVSQKQLTDVKSYWDENMEDYISPEEESSPLPGQLRHEGTTKQGNTARNMPPLFQTSMQEREHEQWQRLSSLPALLGCLPFTPKSECPVYTITTLSNLQRQSPGSGHDPDPGYDPGLSSNSSQQRGQGQAQELGQEPSRYEPYESVSWETLLQTARQFDLRDLEHRAMKALRYHYQLLNLRAIVDKNVAAEVSYHGVDEPTLDLQLALGEQILRSILRLHRCPQMREREDGRILIVDEGKGEDFEPSIISGGSAGLVMPRRRSRNVPGQVHLRSSQIGKLVSWGNVSSSDDDGNDQEEITVEQEEKKGDNKGEVIAEDEGDTALFEDSACEEALMELCTEIRERFLAMREIMQRHQ